MSGKHAAPIVVRLWPKGFGNDGVGSINALVADWEAGVFTLLADHLFSVRVTADLPRQECLLTVESTEELEWFVDRVDHGSRSCRFTCVPRRERLRQHLMPDEYLITQGDVC